MTAEEWQKITELYEAASDLDDESRSAFLAKACDGDSAMRLEVESLLLANSRAGDFITEPIVGLFSDGDPVERIEPGVEIGPYRVVSEIGSGGMGEVFRATDSRLHRDAALKTLPSSFASEPSFRKRFQNEARVTATLNHPNVATVYSIEEFGGKEFIAMEFIQGKTLDQAIPPGGLDLKTFLKWFTAIVDALDHAHTKGVIHRDVKPGNIMISDTGIPKVLDFGLARMVPPKALRSEASLDITEPGQVIGTPSYMSPEQAEGKEIDHRSDIFSLGVVMYEALTGRKPFAGDSNAEIVSNLLKNEPVAISTLRSDVPPEISGLVSRCLSKSRDNRPQNLKEIVAVLDHFWANEQRSVSLSGSALRFYREFSTRSPLRWVAAAVAVVLLAVGARYYFTPDSGLQFSVDKLSLRKLSQTNNVVYAHVMPDGNSIAFNTIEANEMRSLWVRRLADRNALQLLPPQPVQFWGGLTISQDSSSIYYIVAERAARHGVLHRISALGGLPRKMVEQVNDLGSLSPDGKRLLLVRFGDSGNQLISVNALDGSDERIVRSTGPDTHYRDPHFSTDGRRIFAIRFDREAGIEYWSLIEMSAEGGSETVLLPRQKPRISEIAVLADGQNLLLNSTDPISNLPQIYTFSLRDGTLSRLTNDLNSYFGISVDAAGRQIVTSQRDDVMRIWAGEVPDYENMKPLTLETNVYSKVGWTPDGRVVFDGIDNNRPHIYIADREKQNVQQLTPNSSSDVHPRVTSDGKYIVFMSDRTGENRIWRINIDGSDPRMLSPADGVAQGPEISGDDRWVYFSYLSGSGSTYARVPIDGGEITTLNPRSLQYFIPSPDDKLVAFTFVDPQTNSQPKLGIAPLGADAPVKVIDAWPTNTLKWSLDGKSIFFRERDAGANPYASLWQYDLSTDTRKLVFDVTPEVLRDVAWSPDGKLVAVIRGKLVSDAVLISNLGASTPTP